MTIRRKLMLGFISVLLLMGLSVGGALERLGSNGMKTVGEAGSSALEERAQNQLKSVRSAKAEHIEELFRTIRNQIVTFSDDLSVREAAKDFVITFSTVAKECRENNSPYLADDPAKVLAADYAGAHYLKNPLFAANKNLVPMYSPRPAAQYVPADENARLLQRMYIHESGNPNPVGEKHQLDYNRENTSYNLFHNRYHPSMRKYLERFGYYDIFIVDPENGNVVYTVFKEKDYATSLLTGPYKDTNIAQCYREAAEAGRRGDADFVSLVDFAPYEPSYNAPAAFIGSPIMESGVFLGVLIFQMPVDRINEIMLSGSKWASVGLGETGQTYLIGKDYTMRSQSRFNAGGGDILFTSVRNEGAEKAFAGETGGGVLTMPDGRKSLASWQPLSGNALHYVLFAEITADEALAAGKQIENITDDTRHTMLLVAVMASVFAILVGIAIAARIVLSIIRPLGRIQRFSEAVAEGDLKQSLEGEYPGELGHMKLSVESMVTQLKYRLGFAQGVLDGIADRFPVLTVDKDGIIQFINKMLLDSLGKSGTPESYYGKRVGEFFYNDANRRTRTMEALQTKTVVHGEMQVTDGSGKERVLEVTASPLRNLDGELIGAFTIYYDLTTIKAQQDEIRKKNELMAAIALRATEIAETVAESANRLTEQVELVAEGAEQQSARTAETASSMEEMSATVGEVAQHASLASGRAGMARSHAQDGERIVEQVVRSIAEVRNLMDTLRSNMSSLDGQAKDIGRIIGVINDIADQTNLLALNAAIEAARAGDAGRGFAVVADEVRKLAEKTMAATREVEQAITTIQAGTDTSSQATDEATRAVVHSIGLAEKSGETLGIIVTIVDETATMVESIATASEQQSAASVEVSGAVEDINRISGETAEGMVVARNDVAELAEQSNELQDLIKQLHVE